MLLKIKLKNKKLCNWCPAMNSGSEEGVSCNLNYWAKEKEIKTQYKCNHCGEYVDVKSFGNDDDIEQCKKCPPEPGWKGTHYINWSAEIYYRPAECIQENGE
jgi:ribosomal protein L37AE/L43A